MRLRLESVLDADVVVAGGGPSGAATAAYLARGGANVVVVDRAVFPRDKVCGDFVGPAALVELRELGVSDRPEYQRTNRIRDAALYLDGKKLIVRSLPETAGLPAYGRVIPRLTLDSWVLDSARAHGAKVLERRRVTGYTTYDDHVAIRVQSSAGEATLRARALVGADGSSSIVARRVRHRRHADRDRIIAVRAYFEGTEGPADQADLFFSSESFPGYYWLFPTSATTANVGVGMLVSTLPPSSEQLRELLLDLIEHDAGLARRLGGGRPTGRIVGWPLTTFNPYERLVADRVVLVGDAAGLINPLNGEGIQYALQSGRWAGEVLLDALAADDMSEGALASYAATVKDNLRYDMALAGMVVQLIRNRNLNPVWLHALRTIAGRARVDPEYGHVVGSVLAGLIPASDAFAADVIIGTLEQAAMSLGVSTVLEAVRGPRQLASSGGDLARSGIEMMTGSTHDVFGLVEWTAGLATSALELASQLARHRLLDLGARRPQRSRSIM